MTSLLTRAEYYTAALALTDRRSQQQVSVTSHLSLIFQIVVDTDLLLAADESLKFWKLFEKKPGATGFAGAGSSSKAAMVKQMTIR